VIVLLAATVGSSLVSPFIGPSGTPALAGAALVLITGLVVFSRKRGNNTLSVEEVMVVHLSQAIPNLEEYIEKRNESLRNAALRNLEGVLKTLRKWDYGNLSLTERLVGKSVRELREKVEQNVLPALRTGDEQSIRRLVPLLQIMQNSLLLGNYDAENLERWNTALGELPRGGGVKSGVLQSIWSTTLRRIAVLLAGSTVAAAFVHLSAIQFVDASGGEALVAASTVFAGLFAGLSIFALRRVG